jgi:hypothetical protein
MFNMFMDFKLLAFAVPTGFYEYVETRFVCLLLRSITSASLSGALLNTLQT